MKNIRINRAKNGEEIPKLRKIQPLTHVFTSKSATNEWIIKPLSPIISLNAPSDSHLIEEADPYCFTVSRSDLGIISYSTITSLSFEHVK